MQAAVYRNFNQPLTIETIPKPDLPKDGIIIKVMATGVCRSDWHGWKGHDDDIKDFLRRQDKQMDYFVPGHEVSGIVVSVGCDAKRLKAGDRVVVPFILSCGSCRECHPNRNRPTVCEDQMQPGFTMLGSFAEFLAVPRSDRNVCVLPDSVGFCEAAALGCRFTTAYRAIVQQGRLVRGQNVCIVGVGGLGLSCVMIAKSILGSGGGNVIAVDVSARALEKALEVGATHIVDASRGDDHVRSEIIENITHGVGVDLSVDAAGFKSTCENAVFCARRGGRMVQVGLPIGDHLPLVPMGRVAGREIEIVGSHGMAASEMPSILKLVSTRRLDPQCLIEQKVTLREGAKILESMDRISPLGITMIVNPESSEFDSNNSKL